MTTPMRTASFKLPRDLDERLSALAKHRRVSRSALAREALEALTAGKGRSVVDLAGDLIGSLEGPKDLSTNAKHMRDYGK